MEQHVHSMSNLFAQLGQPSDSPAIDRFISENQPLAGSLRLHEAAFWSASRGSAGNHEKFPENRLLF